MESIYLKIIVGSFVIAGIYLVVIYNRFVIVKNDVQKAWGNIDVLLKQRHDEIPNLINTCEAYMKYEKDTLTKVVELRNVSQTETQLEKKAQTEGQLTEALHKLFALAENYPDLKAHEGFDNLRSRISGLESGIANRRESYNESVNTFNIRRQSFPDNIVAGIMGLPQQELFKATDNERRDSNFKINVPS